MTSMNKIPFQSSIPLVQQQINNPSSCRPLSIIPNQQPIVKKNICSKSLIYPFMAWFLFIILTILYFIFVCPWYYHNVCKIIPILQNQ